MAGQDSSAEMEAKGHVGRVYGDYRILAELARGGMGRVYLAVRDGTAGFSRHFAIKVMNHQFEDDQEALLMLLDEAHIASRLHHPNIVPVLDIGTFDDSYYLVMDYVEGCSLHQLMRRNKNYRPPRLLIPIILGALNGLQAVHELRDNRGEPYNVVHRDISPQNLMVGRDGGCRVTDFGIAKAEARFTDTQTGMHKGKIAYMAPEQLLAEEVGPPADIWAMGVTLYAALTATPAFRSKSDAATMHKILAANPSLPSTMGAKPPAVLDEVVMRALALDPRKRFASAKEFGQTLRQVAIENDLLGSPSEIADWVKSSFGDELAERRRMIGQLQGDRPKQDTRSLPKLWLTPGHSSMSGETPHSGSISRRKRLPGESEAPTAYDKPRSDPRVTIPSPGPVPMAEANAPPPEKKRVRFWAVVLGLAVLGAVGMGVTALLSGGGDDENIGESSTEGTITAGLPVETEGPATRVDTPTTGAEPVEEAVVEEPAEEAVVEEPVEEAVVEEPVVRALVRPRTGRRRPRPPTQQTATPPPDPPPAAEPEPTPQPRSLERNPYLRGE